MGYQGEIAINTFVAAMIAFSLVFAAFSSEIWLSALKTLPKGQLEAAAMLGLSKGTTFRRVVLPQLTRIALPGLSNNWLSLLKDTSLVSTISLVDLMRQTSLAVSVTKEPMLFYTVACLGYLFSRRCPAACSMCSNALSAATNRVPSHEHRESVEHAAQRGVA